MLLSARGCGAPPRGSGPGESRAGGGSAVQPSWLPAPCPAEQRQPAGRRAQSRRQQARRAAIGGCCCGRPGAERSGGGSGAACGSLCPARLRHTGTRGWWGWPPPAADAVSAGPIPAPAGRGAGGGGAGRRAVRGAGTREANAASLPSGASPIF